MPVIEIVKQILEKERNGLHYKEIAEKAMILDKSLGSDLELCSKKMSQILSAHVKRHERKPTALFRRISNGKGGFKAGVFALIQKPTSKLSPPVNRTPVSTIFTGKAGEYGVFSELLYWGYNPAMMVVDHGIDIVATKDGDYFHIQVKTANTNASKSFSFKIDKASFQLHENAKTFYVFVIRRDIKGRKMSEYVILPSSMISHLIKSQVISPGKDISFVITIDHNHFKINDSFTIPDVNDFSKIR